MDTFTNIELTLQEQFDELKTIVFLNEKGEYNQPIQMPSELLEKNIIKPHQLRIITEYLRNVQNYFAYNMTKMIETVEKDMVIFSECGTCAYALDHRFREYVNSKLDIEHIRLFVNTLCFPKTFDKCLETFFLHIHAFSTDDLDKHAVNLPRSLKVLKLTGGTYNYQNNFCVFKLEQIIVIDHHKIPRLDQFSNINTVRFERCSFSPSDQTRMANVENLSFDFCETVNLCQVGHKHKYLHTAEVELTHLHLFQCAFVKNVNAINGTHTVTIKNCHNIETLDGVRDIENLLISNCKNIDGGELSKVHKCVSLSIKKLMIKTLTGCHDIKFMHFYKCENLTDVKHGDNVGTIIYEDCNSSIRTEPINDGVKKAKIKNFYEDLTTTNHVSLFDGLELKLNPVNKPYSSAKFIKELQFESTIGSDYELVDTSDQNEIISAGSASNSPLLGSIATSVPIYPPDNNETVPIYPPEDVISIHDSIDLKVSTSPILSSKHTSSNPRCDGDEYKSSDEESEYSMKYEEDVQDIQKDDPSVKEEKDMPQFLLFDNEDTGHNTPKPQHTYNLSQLYNFRMSSEIYNEKQIQLFLSPKQTDKYIADEEFRNYVNAFVKEPKQQISLFLYVDKNYSERYDTFQPYIKMIKHVDWNKCDVVNISEWFHILSLELTDCDGITDLSPLINLQILDICSCEGIKHIPYLPCIKQVRLMIQDHTKTWCPDNKIEKIDIMMCDYDRTEISKMNSIESLTIDACENLEEVEWMSNISHIKINNMNGGYDFSKLCGNKTITLLTTNITKYPDFTDAEELSIEQCRIPETLDSLGGIKHLSLKNCNNISKITDTDALSKMVYVSIDSCPKITDVSMFKDVEHLVLRNVKFTDTASLAKVRHLELYECQGDMDVSVLKNVDTLKIEKCHNITGTEELGRYQKLEINNCQDTSVVFRRINGKMELFVGGKNITDEKTVGKKRVRDDENELEKSQKIIELQGELIRNYQTYTFNMEKQLDDNLTEKSKHIPTEPNLCVFGSLIIASIFSVMFLGFGVFFPM
jgi:hypothetical protein